MDQTDQTLNELGAVVRRYAARHHPLAAARRLLDDPTPHDGRAWHALRDGLGAAALLDDDELPRLPAMAAVQAELGSVLAATPWFATMVLAGTVLAASGVAARDVLADRTAALVLPADVSGGDDGPTMRLDPSGRHVTGTAAGVLDGATADVLVVAVPTSEGVVLGLADPGAGTATPVRPLDATRPVADVALSGVEIDVVARPTTSRWDGAIAEVAVLVTAEMVAGARACLEATLEHARARHAFGRPIGSFQAVKHACADLHVAIESAAALHTGALHAHVDGDPGAAMLARLAHALGAEAFLEAADAQVRLTGGIGFTWEHDAHLYLRRATAMRSLLGRPDQHWEVAASLAGL